MSARHVVLGHISGVFGVAGWVKLVSYTQPIDNILDYSTWHLGAERRPYRRVAGKCHAGTLIAQLAGADGAPIRDRNAAAVLVDAPVAVTREAMPALPPGQYYWCDLIGLAVYNRDGAHLGRVENMLATGGHDVLVIAGERERLIPFVVGQLVDKVDRTGGVIRVDWPADA